MMKLRAGLVGLGMMGRHHARVLSTLDGVELVGVADPGGDAHGAASGVAVLGSVENLIKKGLDYCVVAVPTAFHEDIGISLAEAGVNALVEKPLASSTEGALKLAVVFENAGLIGAVGHIERYNPALQQARSRLESGELGEIFQVSTRRQGPFPARVSDVGVVKDLGTHDIDLTAWVTQQDYVTVSARTAHRSGRAHEDLVAAVGTLSRGAIANHLVNWLSPLKERVVVITGEKGAYAADTLTADLTYYANGDAQHTWDGLASFRGVSEGDTIRYSFSKPEPLRTEHEAFRDAVIGKGTDIVTMRQGVAVVQVAEACLESARLGVTVDLSERSTPRDR